MAGDDDRQLPPDPDRVPNFNTATLLQRFDESLKQLESRIQLVRARRQRKVQFSNSRRVPRRITENYKKVSFIPVKRVESVDRQQQDDIRLLQEYRQDLLLLRIDQFHILQEQLREQQQLQLQQQQLDQRLLQLKEEYQQQLQQREQKQQLEQHAISCSTSKIDAQLHPPEPQHSALIFQQQQRQQQQQQQQPQQRPQQQLEQHQHFKQHAVSCSPSKTDARLHPPGPQHSSFIFQQQSPQQQLEQQQRFKQQGVSSSPSKFDARLRPPGPQHSSFIFQQQQQSPQQQLQQQQRFKQHAVSCSPSKFDARLRPPGPKHSSFIFQQQQLQQQLEQQQQFKQHAISSSPSKIDARLHPPGSQHSSFRSQQQQRHQEQNRNKNLEEHHHKQTVNQVEQLVSSIDDAIDRGEALVVRTKERVEEREVYYFMQEQLEQPRQLQQQQQYQQQLREYQQRLREYQQQLQQLGQHNRQRQQFKQHAVSCSSSNVDAQLHPLGTQSSSFIIQQGQHLPQEQNSNQNLDYRHHQQKVNQVGVEQPISSFDDEAESLPLKKRKNITSHEEVMEDQQTKEGLQVAQKKAPIQEKKEMLTESTSSMKSKKMVAETHADAQSHVDMPAHPNFQQNAVGSSTVETEHAHLQEKERRGSTESRKPKKYRLLSNAVAKDSKDMARQLLKFHMDEIRPWRSTNTEEECQPEGSLMIELEHAHLQEKERGSMESRKVAAEAKKQMAPQLETPIQAEMLAHPQMLTNAVGFQVGDSSDGNGIVGMHQESTCTDRKNPNTEEDLARNLPKERKEP